MTTLPVRKFRLAPHVRACHSEDQVILLDLLKNKYLGVGSTALRALAGTVEGWPGGDVERNDAAPTAGIEALTLKLHAQGLLTEGFATRLPDVAIDEVTASLNAEDAARDLYIGPRRIFRFIRCASAVVIALRTRSMFSIAQGVARRRDRFDQEKVDRPSMERLAEAVAAYETLRPLAFAAQNNCLRDSLMLSSFLASEGLFPRWVVGVQTRPFGAHSWLQCGSVVLNDQHDHVRRFQPILVV